MAGSKGSWAKTKEAMENQGGGTFLRLENDGDTAVVAFCDAPFPRDICFNQKTNQYEPWDDTQKAAGRKKQTKYLMNVFVLTVLGKRVDEVKVIDMNFNTMTTVEALKDKYTLGKCFFEIKRHGAKGDTKTQYAILPDQDIAAEQRAIFGTSDPKNAEAWIDGTMPLHDLAEIAAKGVDDESTAVADDVKGGKKKAAANTNGTASAAAPAPAAATAAPSGELISKAVATEIIEKLKPLDSDKGINPFRARFPYIKKVSEVRASDEAAARAYATELSGGKPAQEDPFA